MDMNKRVMLLKVAAAAISTNPLQNTLFQDSQQSIAMGQDPGIVHANLVQSVGSDPPTKDIPASTQGAPGKAPAVTSNPKPPGQGNPPTIVTPHAMPGQKRTNFANPYDEQMSRNRSKSGLAKRTGDVQVAGMKTTTRSIM